MYQVIFDYSVFICITVLGAFLSPQPALLVILAGLFMVFYAYGTLLEAPEKKLAFGKAVLLMGYAAFSGTFLGSVAFVFLRECRVRQRVLLTICCDVAMGFLCFPRKPHALKIVEFLGALAVFYGVFGVQYLLERSLQTKEREAQRVLASNISELHTRRANEQLIRDSYIADKNARLLERENISRNIHNSVGHSITAAIMTLDAADMLYDVRPEEARKKMQDANERIRGSLDSIRRAVRMLDEEAKEIPAGDLKCEMGTIMDNFMMDTERSVESHFDQLRDEVSIPQEHASFLAGVLEELLTNGAKHGQADHFVVLLMGDDAHIRLMVSDNGSSDFGEENQSGRIENGFGLKKILSYVNRCGGKAEFVNRGGFSATVELPLYGGKQS